MSAAQAPPALGRGFGHGKVILVGEHAVVHGLPALAAGISAGISVEARPGRGQLSIPAWSLQATAGDGSAVGRALEALLDRVGGRALDFLADAGIPSRAGLGSSAAMAVGVARAAAQATGRLDDAQAIDEAVSAAEGVFHGKPSGIDAAAARSGAVGLYRRGDGWRTVPVRQAITLCVGLSGRGHDTMAEVAAVGRLRERMPVVQEILAMMGRLADDAAAALQLGHVDELGRIFDAAHGLLCAVRVSSPELDTLVHAARAAGAVGAKLTGAGGGGAVIALAPGHERDVLARWRAAGFEGFTATIAATATAAAAAGEAAQ